MILEQESKWREEFEEFIDDRNVDHSDKYSLERCKVSGYEHEYEDGTTWLMLEVYVEARQKAQEEIERIERKYERMINDYRVILMMSLVKKKERNYYIRELIYQLENHEVLKVKAEWLVLIEKAKKLVGEK